VCCWLCFCFLIGTGVKCRSVLYLYTQIGCSGLNREDLSKVPSSFKVLLRMPLQNQSSAGSNFTCAPWLHSLLVAMFTPHQKRDIGELFAPGFVLGSLIILLVMLLHII